MVWARLMARLSMLDGIVIIFDFHNLLVGQHMGSWIVYTLLVLTDTHSVWLLLDAFSVCATLSRLKWWKWYMSTTKSAWSTELYGPIYFEFASANIVILCPPFQIIIIIIEWPSPKKKKKKKPIPSPITPSYINFLKILSHTDAINIVPHWK